MAITRTINIKNSALPELIEIFGAGYMPKILQITDNPDGSQTSTVIDNPQSQAQFAGQQFDKEVREFIKGKVIAHRMRIADASIDQTEILE